MLGGLWLVAIAGAAHAAGDALPWIVLRPKNDTRDEEMRAWDEADSLAFVTAFNEAEEFATSRLRWTVAEMDKIDEGGAPFAELRVDPVRPMEFTSREKTALHEWLRRGGFLLLVEDCYPYPQERFRALEKLPAYEFLVRELPALDPEFRAIRVNDSHPIFRAYYRTSTGDWMAREQRENPNYRGRTLLLHRDKPAAFVMGRYGVQKDGRWVPAERPLRHRFGRELNGYQLIVNLYCHAMMSPAEPMPSPRVGAGESTAP